MVTNLAIMATCGAMFGALWWINERANRAAGRSPSTPAGRRERRRRIRAYHWAYGVKIRTWVVVLLFAAAVGYTVIALSQHG